MALSNRSLTVLTICALALLTLPSACSGSGGAASRSAFAFPIDAPQALTMAVVDAFPGLDFQRPVLATTAPGSTGRLFVVEQGGRILVFDDNPSVTSAQVFLDISSRVTANTGEMGLLGLAFAPDYATSGYFYVYYTRQTPLESVLAEFQVTADPAVADPGSERIMLVEAQPFSNHNAGMLAFGPDDYLYVALGDGGGGGDPEDNGQDLATRLGSLLRIEPRGSTGGLPYGIPPDNPFRTQISAFPEIYAYGLRNPWRFSFDRDTGELWLADVGQGAREEVHIVESGDNLGWPVFEGSLEFRNPGQLPATAFTQPVFDYDRTQGTSISGGVVYRGSRFPELRGAYLYGDWVSGTVWALRGAVRGGDRQAVTNTVLTQVTNIVAFGEDEDGEPLLVSHQGSLFRLEPLQAAAAGFPATLSATGLFADLMALQPAAGLVEYAINSEAWRDGAYVRRFVAAPLQAIEYDDTQPWAMPVGTVLVKHFELALVTGDPTSRKRLETRVLIHEANGWGGYTYRWNDAGTEAQLLAGREVADYTVIDPMAAGGQRTQRWTYPSRVDCRRCHLGGQPIAVRSQQLHRDFEGQPQLPRLLDAGVLSVASTAGAVAWPDPHDTAATDAQRARSYLQSNCAYCHGPGGASQSPIDLRYDIAQGAMGVVDSVPNFGNPLGLPDPRIVRPGDRANSELLQRMLRRDAAGMPPLGSHEIDLVGSEIVGRWIDGL